MIMKGVIRSRLLGYGVINAVAAGATFLAVPVLIRLIGMDGFGTWSLIEPIVFIGAAIAFLGAEHGIMRDIAFERRDVGTVLGEILGCSGPAVVMMSALVGLAAWIFVSFDLAILVASLAAVEGLLVMATSTARAARRTLIFAVGQIGRTLGFLILLILLLLSEYPAGIAEVLALRLALVAVLSVVVITLLRPRWSFALARYGSALRYGGFILASSMVTMVLEMADRYLVGAHGDTTTVGAYMVHVKIASIVGQGIVMPFSLWFAPERLRHMDDPDGGAAFYNRVALGLTVTCAIVAGAAFLAGPALVAVLAPDVSFDPVSMGALLIAASVIGLTYALNIGLLRPGMTHLNIAPVVAGVLIMLALGPLLVPLFGPSGAALARLAGTVVFLILLAWLSQRVYRVAFSYGSISALAFGAVALIAAIHLLVAPAGAGDWQTAVQRVALFLSLSAAALIAAREYSRGSRLLRSERAK